MRASLLLAALACGLPARAATVRGPADVETLASAADAVVRARVLRKESGWGAGGSASGLIFTRVVLEPLEWWKGEGSSQIVVRVPGGTVGELTQNVQGAAEFGASGEVVLFLRRLGKEAKAGGAHVEVFEVERLALGKFDVGGVVPGRARAMRDRSKLACVGCRAGEEDDFSLDELRARVLGARGRSTRK